MLDDVSHHGIMSDGNSLDVEGLKKGHSDPPRASRTGREEKFAEAWIFGETFIYELL